jgi:hypothetical protein
MVSWAVDEEDDTRVPEFLDLCYFSHSLKLKHLLLQQRLKG